jgi:hypothetical protein
MRAMAEDAQSVVRAAIESGTLRSLADLYTADAVFEGYLPGGIREAAGGRRPSHDPGSRDTMPAGVAPSAAWLRPPPTRRSTATA